MGLLKKIIIPVILFIILIVFSVKEFDYNKLPSINTKVLLDKENEKKESNEENKAINLIKDDEIEDDIPKIEEIQEIINKVDEDAINEIDEENKEEIENKPLKPEELQLLINNALSINKINFERNSTKVTKESKTTLEEIVKILKENPTFKVEIAGHTDSRGAASLNKRISQDRASSVLEILVSMGIDKNRLKAVGYGEDQPLEKDDTNGLSEANRRVEFSILGEE